MSRSDDEELGFQVLRAIRRIVRRVSTYSRSVGRSTGLGVPQLLCMRAIEDHDADEVTVAAVADAIHLSRSTVSVMVDKLVRSGLVSRVRSDVDRRRVHLSLTETGRARLAEMPQPLEERFLARLAALDDDERQQILDGLERVVRLMDADELDASPVLVADKDELAT